MGKFAALFSYLTLTHDDSARVVNRLLTRKIDPSDVNKMLTRGIDAFYHINITVIEIYALNSSPGKLS